MRPSRLLATAALLIAVPLTGCAAGQNDGTSQERATPYQADANIGDVKIRAVTVTPAGATTGAAPGATGTAPPTTTPGVGTPQAYLSFTLASTSVDNVTNISIPGGSVSPVDARSASLTVRPGVLVIVSAPATGTGNPAVAISGLATPPVVGTTVPVTFTFANAGTVTVQAPVRDAAVA